MATVTSQVSAIITDLHTVLSGRAGLSDVTIFKRAPSPKDEETPKKYLTIMNTADGSQQHPALTLKIKDEDFTLNGLIQVVKEGVGDAIAELAQEEAEGIMAEIEDAVLTDTRLTRRAHTQIIELQSYEHSCGGGTNTRMHRIQISIHCKTHLISS